MKTVVFSTHKFERDSLIKANGEQHERKLVELPLNIDTAHLAEDAEASNDNSDVLISTGSTIIAAGARMSGCKEEKEIKAL